MKNKLEELEGECKLLITDEMREFGEKCYKAGYKQAMKDIKKGVWGIEKK